MQDGNSLPFIRDNIKYEDVLLSDETLDQAGRYFYDELFKYKRFEIEKDYDAIVIMTGYDIDKSGLF